MTVYVDDDFEETDFGHSESSDEEMRGSVSESVEIEVRNVVRYQQYILLCSNYSG